MRGEEIAYLGRNEAGEEGVHYVAVMSYPSGEPLVKERPQRVDRVLLRPKSMVGFLGGVFWLESVKHRVAWGSPFEVILPMPPGTRQDRWNDSGDALFTIKSVGRIINALDLPRVIVVDPHSDVTAAAINRCHVIRPVDFWERDPDEPYAGVVSPDAGAEKRAGAVASKLGVPLIHGWKTRDVNTGSISGFGIEPMHWSRGHRVLVVDDLCDGGGTFVGLGEVLRREGFHADLFVTHGLFTKGTSELRAHYLRVICTDSVVVDRPGISVVKVCEQLLRKGTLK